MGGQSRFRGRRGNRHYPWSGWDILDWIGGFLGSGSPDEIRTWCLHRGHRGDLDRAAHDLSEAIAILGIQAVLAFLFRGRPNVRRIDPGPPPPRTPGARYRPTTTYEPLPRGTLGVTDSWGKIKSRHFALRPSRRSRCSMKDFIASSRRNCISCASSGSATAMDHTSTPHCGAILKKRSHRQSAK